MSDKMDDLNKELIKSTNPKDESSANPNEQDNSDETNVENTDNAERSRKLSEKGQQYLIDQTNTKLMSAIKAWKKEVREFHLKVVIY